MSRRNSKKQHIDYENSIKKSNELSMAQLNKGLSLNQMQLLAFTIFCTQQDGSTEFIKADFEKKFNINQYKTEDAYIDSEKVSALRYSTQDLENKRFRFTAIFTDLQYDNGTFKVEWNTIFLPHILELKDYYVTTDLTIASKFKSSFSWVLYEFLKARYGAYYLSISKDALLRLFGVENRKTYVSSTAQFKRTVLNKAIEEINEYTELEVWYKDKKQGRAIVGFEIHWSTGSTVPIATKAQMRELDRLIDEVYWLSNYIHQIPEGAEKEEALKIIVETETFRRSEDEDPLTSAEAKDYIPVLRNYIRKLDTYVKTKERTVKRVPFYNWLVERE